MTNFEIFRANLRLLRAERRISGNDLSKALNMKAAKRINDLEEGRIGKPTLDELLEIARYFEIQVDCLLYQKAHIKFEPLLKKDTPESLNP